MLSFSIFVLPAHADNDKTIVQMRESLISQGLFPNFVNSISDSQIEELYDALESEKAEIKIIKKYASIDAKQSFVNNYGLINQDNFELGIAEFFNYDNKNRLIKLIVAIIWQWDGGNPAGRRDDLLHVYWEPSCFTFTTENFTSVDFYTKYSGEYVEYNESNLPAQSTTRDMAFYTNVYSGFGLDRGGWCVFTMDPALPMYKGNDFSTPISVTYYHNKSLVPYINNFTITKSESGLGINFQPTLTDSLASSISFKYSR